MRIAILTRKAYRCGLHQLDSLENNDSFGLDKMSQELLEDWCHVWSCVYIYSGLLCQLLNGYATPNQDRERQDSPRAKSAV